MTTLTMAALEAAIRKLPECPKLPGLIMVNPNDVGDFLADLYDAGGYDGQVKAEKIVPLGEVFTVTLGDGRARPMVWRPPFLPISASPFTFVPPA